MYRHYDEAKGCIVAVRARRANLFHETADTTFAKSGRRGNVLESAKRFYRRPNALGPRWLSRCPPPPPGMSPHSSIEQNVSTGRRFALQRFAVSTFAKAGPESGKTFPRVCFFDGETFYRGNLCERLPVETFRHRLDVETSRGGARATEKVSPSGPFCARSAFAPNVSTAKRFRVKRFPR